MAKEEETLERGTWVLSSIEVLIRKQNTGLAYQEFP